LRCGSCLRARRQCPFISASKVLMMPTARNPFF
jgi:hypothetical protein